MLWNSARDKAVVSALKFNRRHIFLNYEVWDRVVKHTKWDVGKIHGSSAM